MRPWKQFGFDIPWWWYPRLKRIFPHEIPIKAALWVRSKHIDKTKNKMTCPALQDPVHEYLAFTHSWGHERPREHAVWTRNRLFRGLCEIDRVECIPGVILGRYDAFRTIRKTVQISLVSFWNAVKKPVRVYQQMWHTKIVKALSKGLKHLSLMSEYASKIHGVGYGWRPIYSFRGIVY